MAWQDFCSPEGLWGASSLLFNGYEGCFPFLKQLGCVDYSSSSGAEVKNDWIFTSAPPTLLRGMDRGQLYPPPPLLSILHLYWF